MKLKKTIPARTATFTASQCQIDWIEMTPRFREIRAGARNKMDKCHWCKHPFADGEKMSLAISDKGNKVLCRSCAEQLTGTTP